MVFVMVKDREITKTLVNDLPADDERVYVEYRDYAIPFRVRELEMWSSMDRESKRRMLRELIKRNIAIPSAECTENVIKLDYNDPEIKKQYEAYKKSLDSARPQ